MQFSDHLRRQNDLIIDGWKLLRFSFDDIKDNPRFCQQKLQQFMGRWLGTETYDLGASYTEKEVIRLAIKLARPFTPGDVCAHFGIENKTARKWLQQMVNKKWLKPASGSTRVRSYELELELENKWVTL